jgi:pyruvate/2-oxoglutarate dehydrogenase complex dihydrolipoamide acyltransferase (E2) component
MVEVVVPRDSVNDESVIVVKVRIPSGVLVNPGDIVVDVETSKTIIELPSPQHGIVNHNLEVGQEIGIGGLLYTVENAATQHAPVKTSAQPSVNTSKSPAKISKAAYARAAQLGIDPASFTEGWVTVAQIEAAAGLKPATALSRPSMGGRAARDPPRLQVEYQTEETSKRKRTEVQNLLKGDHQATSSTIAIRMSCGVRVVQPPFLFRRSISDLLVFEAARLLLRYPELNGCFLDPKSWGRYSSINFGISFDNGNNLKVLTIADACKRTLAQIQEEIERMMHLYESGEPIPDSLLASSTVTLSDLSSQDASFMLPLINGHQSLILGVVRQPPDSFEVFASFDHRLAEGMRVVNFLGELKERIVSHYRSGTLDVESLKCHACDKTLAEEQTQFGNPGFLLVAVSASEERYFCRNCFEGD